ERGRRAVDGPAVAAATTADAHDRLVALEANGHEPAQFDALASREAAVVSRGGAGEAALDADRAVDPAVDREDDVDGLVDRAELHRQRGRAPPPTGALAVRDEPPLVDPNRILELVDLHTVPQTHARRPRRQDREPTVRRRRGATEGLAQNHLIHERG